MSTAKRAAGAWSKFVSIEGYLAFALFVLSMFSGGCANTLVILAPMISLAAGFAVGGARFGVSGNRVYALVTLGLFSLWLLFVLVASIDNLDSIVSYWRL